MAKQSFDPVLPVPVLVTRPEAQARGFVRALQQRFGAGLRPVLSPLMAPRLLMPDLPSDDFAAVIFTSTTGVAAAAGLQGALPRLAWCVGRKTAETADAAGFQARSADGDAEALVAAILADPPGGPLLHLRGQDTTGDLAGRLTAAGLPAQDLVVYRQEPHPLSDTARDLLMAEGPVILPLFSPRSVALMAQALPKGAKARLFLAALSPAVADAAADLPRVALVTARRPDADAMLEAVADLIVAASPP